jgi:hypothetical protein
MCQLMKHSNFLRASPIHRATQRVAFIDAFIINTAAVHPAPSFPGLHGSASGSKIKDITPLAAECG